MLTPALQPQVVSRRGGLTVVVVGNGMASHAFCERVARRAAAGALRVVVFGDEPVPAYNRVRLSDVLLGTRSTDLILSSRSWYADHGFDLRLGDPVVQVDRAKQLVRTASGATQPYDRLVLATGSTPWRPPVAGVEHPRCFVYRTLADLEAIEARLTGVAEAVVIGGGLLGLEAAKVLLDRGVGVCVIESGRSLMHRQLDAQSAALLQQKIENIGVRVRTGATLERIDHDEHRATVVLADGVRLPADVVIVAAGVRPNDALARDARLDCNVRGGVVVDPWLTTSDAAISAIGECASVRGSTYGLYAPCRQMAVVAADNALGDRQEVQSFDQSCHLKLLGIDVVALGDYGNEHRAVVFSDAESRRTLLLERGVIVGAQGVGSWPDLLRVERDIAQKCRISERNVARFETVGISHSGGSPLPVASWPDTAVVCNCMRVSAGQIRSLARTGACDANQVAATTGAMTVCGSCRPLVGALVGDAAAVGDMPRTWGISGLSLVALITALLTILAPRVDFAQSVQLSTRALDRLWRDAWLKQLSGFVLVGLVVLALLLSIRKRWKHFRFGDFALYRSLHGLIGTATLAVLLAHTGFRLGHNLNLWLMVTFLLLNIVGGATGFLSGMEARVDSPMSAVARRLRQPVSIAHITTFWPLPLLLGWHVLAVYYF